MPKHLIPAAPEPQSLPSSRRAAVVVDDGEVPTCSKHIKNLRLPEESFGTFDATSKNKAVYVSNLHASVDEGGLNYIFRRVGPIRSISVTRSKLAKDPATYAVIHYEDVASVQSAIAKCSGLIYKDQQIKVERYQTLEEREKTRPFTNLYIKNFIGAFANDGELLDLFRPFGTITSSKLERDIEGSFKGFGFICYERPEFAAEAIKTLHGRVLHTGSKLYVAKHESKQQRGMKNKPNTYFIPNGMFVPNYLPPAPQCRQERVTILTYNQNVRGNMPNVAPSRLPMWKPKPQFTRPVAVTESETKLNADIRALSIPRQRLATSTSTPCPVPSWPPALHLATLRWKNNIYVKNIRGFADTDFELYDVFSRFGQILSAVVMKDNHSVSKGFGFICFKSQFDAQVAIKKMHLATLSNGKVLFCGEAQKKTERQAELRTKFRSNAGAEFSRVAAMHRNGVNGLCNICYTVTDPSDCVMFDCCHINCKSCLTDWFTVLITERQVNSFLCLGEDCKLEISTTLVKTLVTKELYEAYDKILLENFLATQSDIVHCPSPGCEAFIELDFSEPTRGHCDLCQLTFCTNCLDPYHGTGPCDEIDDAGFDSVIQQYVEGTPAVKEKLEHRFTKRRLEKGLETKLTNPFLNANCKQCPNCKANIQKNGGCNHMECFKCKTHFCWLCLFVAADAAGVTAHFRVGEAPGTCHQF